MTEGPARFDPQRARALREARNMTQDQLAVLVSRPCSTIVKFERGEIRPSMLTLGRLANALHVPVAEFFDGPPDWASYEDDPLPSDHGAAADKWFRATAAAMPPMTDEQARRISALLFPAPPD